MPLPSFQEIENLHRKYAPNQEALNEVWGHCLVVKEIADWLMDNNPGYKVDRQLVEVGCLLHDIGIYRFYQDDGNYNDYGKYVSHGVLGAEILKDEGFGDEICGFAARHTGLGISKAEVERNNLPLPVADYVPLTNEERLVMYADKFHSKGPSEFNSAEWYKQKVANKFGPENIAKFDTLIAEFGVPPVAEMAKAHNQPLI